MDNNPHNKIDDFLKESLGNYEVPYNPGDWLDMEKKLDLFSKGKSNWFKKSSIYSKLFAGTLIVSIAAFIVFYYNKDDKPGFISKKSAEELITRQSTETIQPHPDHPQMEGKAFAQNSPKRKNEAENLWDQIYTENLSGNKNMTDKEKPHLPVDENNNIITSYSNNEPANDKVSKSEMPWLGMLRGAYVEKNQQFPIPSAAFTTNITKGCRPLIVQFQADNTDVPKTYLWSFGDGFYSYEPNPKHLYEQNGIYNITLTVTSLMDEKTETNTIRNKITIYSPPQAIFDWDRKEPNIINRAVNFTGLSKDAVQWQWNFGDNETSIEQHPRHFYPNKGTYKVELIVKNAFGCHDTAYSYITIAGKIKDDEFYAPTAFSPNGDGINDVFRPVAVGITESEFEMSIHDRNGNLIYETTDINQPWDGKIIGNNRIAQEGIYIWLVIIKDKYGKQHKYVGHVTLLK